jgi:hypothetical protein
MHASFSLEKSEGNYVIYLFIYLFCPGGAKPAGFWFSVSCVNPSPWHVGCCPGGVKPDGFVQEVSTEVILADAEVMNAGAIANASATAVTAASAANVTLCVFISKCISHFV